MKAFDKIKSIFIKKPRTGTNPSGLFTLSGGLSRFEYDRQFNATYVSCAEALARHFGKTKIVIENEETQKRNLIYLNEILGLKPNPVQSSYSLLNGFAYDYYARGLGLLYIEWDYSDPTHSTVSRLWPIDSRKIAIANQGTKIYLKFNLNGQEIADVIDNFIVVVKSVRSDDCLNTQSPQLDQIIKVLQTNNEGIVKAVENSNKIQFIARMGTMMKKEDLDKKQKDFNDRMANGDTILVTQIGEDLQQVSNQSKYATNDDVREMKKDVYQFFGVNEKFLDGSFSDAEWQAIYESAIEPLAIQLEQELNSKILTKREREMKNYIRVVTEPLQAASLATRIKVAETYLKLPTIKPNTVCDILYLPRLENGDKEVQSLNFVNSQKVDDYQGVGGKDKNPKEDDEDGSETDE